MIGEQPSLFDDQPDVKKVMDAVLQILKLRAQPSAWELLDYLDFNVGLKARWSVSEAIQRLIEDRQLTSVQRDFLSDLLASDDWSNALGGSEKPRQKIESTIDLLFSESEAYRNSESFQEMVSFMANFRDYAPFNNMLVRIQNPSCSFYATQRDWEKRFKRFLIEDAKPMLILAPMHVCFW